MQFNSLRIALLLLAIAGTSLAMADQKIKTKSNIKNDRLAESSSVAACADEKEGSADGKTACKTLDTKSSASSAASKEAEKTKPQ
jgi:hypothetical protein